MDRGFETCSACRATDTRLQRGPKCPRRGARPSTRWTLRPGQSHGSRRSDVTDRALRRARARSRLGRARPTRWPRPKLVATPAGRRPGLFRGPPLGLQVRSSLVNGPAGQRAPDHLVRLEMQVQEVDEGPHWAIARREQRVDGRAKGTYHERMPTRCTVVQATGGPDRSSVRTAGAFRGRQPPPGPDCTFITAAQQPKYD